jgi:hypothetical protein
MYERGEMMLAIKNCFPLKEILKEHNAKWCGVRKAWLISEEMFKTIEEKAMRGYLGKQGYLLSKVKTEVVVEEAL